MEKTAMKFTKLALTAALFAAAPAAIAQDATPATTSVAVGATVNGNDGNPVGTVEAISGEVVVINTGKHKAPVPAAAIASNATGLSVNITQGQLNEMMDAQVAQAIAKRDAALVAGAEVVSANGNPAGTLAEVDMAADMIVLASPAGKVALKKEHFAVDAQGRLMALFTREQINTAAAAGGGSATGASN
jgi:hypothetical protein